MTINYEKKAIELTTAEMKESLLPEGKSKGGEICQGRLIKRTCIST